MGQSTPMTGKKRDTSSPWVDPDEAPELTDDFFTTATPFIGERQVSREEFKAAARQAFRGRPVGSGNKQSAVHIPTSVERLCI